MAARILIVEDEALVADDIQRTLVRLGYDAPVIASSAREALAAAAHIQPQLVLMDVKIQGLRDGIDTARELRERYAIPIVYLTSYSDEATLLRAKETQPHGFLLKPFDDRELRSSIEVALHKHTLEARLVDRERWFSTTLQSIGDAVIATDPTATVTFMNEVAEKLTGWARTDAVGKDIARVMPLVDHEGAAVESPVVRALRSSVPVEVPADTKLVTKGGTRLDVDDSAAPIIDAAGAVLGGVVVFRDVTERKKLNRRVSQSERLAAIGSMAAGMGHEINNPLTYVIGNVSFAAEELQGALEDLQVAADGPAASPMLDLAIRRLRELGGVLAEASSGANRVRKIVQELRTFSRAEEPKPSVLDLPELLDVAVQMTSTTLRHHARLRKNYGSTPYVDADEGQLVQVFTNLLINAAQAIGDGDASQNEVTITTYTDLAGRAIVEVQDTGPGIESSLLAKVFDPFFSTKAGSSGTGIGLSICYNVITALGGEICAESELGHGATFRVTLEPTTAITKSARSEIPPTKTDYGQRGKVLVIDDELAVCKAVERMLRSEHDVTILTDGRIALERIARGERYDMIFCDLMMPSITGMEVYTTLRATNPEQADRVVFTTGGTFSEFSKTFLATTSNIVVPKPFNTATLRSVTRGFVK